MPPRPRTTGLEYNHAWIREGETKLDCIYSNVLIWETSDPERGLQYRRHVEGGGIRISRFAPWTGLQPPERPDAATAAVDPLPQEVTDLPQALRILDRRLKAAKTVVILEDLNPTDVGRSRLQDAILSWSTNEEIRAQESRVIVFTWNAEALLDKCVRERCIILRVSPSTDAERASLVGSRVRGPEASTAVTMTRGLNLTQTRAVLLEAQPPGGKVDLDRLARAKANLIKQCNVLEVVDVPKQSFDSIGGYASLKAFLRTTLVSVLSDGERAARLATSLPRGILLFGPPGTGKTLFANALAKELCVPFIRLRSENIFGPLLGQSGRQLKEAIAMIEAMSPAIVFVDEIDQLGQRKQPTDSAGEETRRVFSQLLDWLSDADRCSLLLGTTNRPGDLDEAFTRPGRLDFKLPVFYPDSEARMEILMLHLGLAKTTGQKQRGPALVKPEQFSGFVREKIVPKTELFSGAELEALVRRAKFLALGAREDALSTNHLARALQDSRINREERVARLRECLAEVRQFSQEVSFERELLAQWGHLLNGEVEQ